MSRRVASILLLLLSFLIILLRGKVSHLLSANCFLSSHSSSASSCREWWCWSASHVPLVSHNVQKCVTVHLDAEAHVRLAHFRLEIARRAVGDVEPHSFPVKIYIRYIRHCSWKEKCAIKEGLIIITGNWFSSKGAFLLSFPSR